MKLFLTCGAAFGFLSVALGAFAAHALKERLDAAQLAIFETGVRYQMYHALALLAVGILGEQRPASTLLHYSGYAFAAGILLFSGSLYLLVATGIKTWGAVTPIGGVAFLIGWVLLALT